jgi:hypothetical protein
MKKHQRPKRIIVRYVDPFDGRWVCTSDYAYDARMAADYFYSRAIRKMKEGLKSIQSHVLEGRTPKAEIEIVY